MQITVHLDDGQTVTGVLVGSEESDDWHLVVPSATSLHPDATGFVRLDGDSFSVSHRDGVFVLAARDGIRHRPAVMPRPGRATL